MATTIGFCLSGVIALAIVAIGICFLIAPHLAAESYGVPVVPNVAWDAFLSVKAVRDIASGIFTTILILNRSAHLLGWFMLFPLLTHRLCFATEAPRPLPLVFTV